MYCSTHHLKPTGGYTAIDPIRFEAVHVESPSDLSALLNLLRRYNRVEYVTIDLPNPGGGGVPDGDLIPISVAVFALDLAG